MRMNPHFSTGPSAHPWGSLNKQGGPWWILPEVGFPTEGQPDRQLDPAHLVQQPHVLYPSLPQVALYCAILGGLGPFAPAVPRWDPARHTHSGAGSGGDDDDRNCPGAALSRSIKAEWTVPVWFDSWAKTPVIDLQGP